MRAKGEGKVLKEKARFDIGQLVRHRLFGYRGVIVDVDSVFSGMEEWYEAVARTRPPKDQPWYHVLVSESNGQTYVAERNLEADPSREPIKHPSLRSYFSDFDGRRYLSRSRAN